MSFVSRNHPSSQSPQFSNSTWLPSGLMDSVIYRLSSLVSSLVLFISLSVLSLCRSTLSNNYKNEIWRMWFFMIQCGILLSFPWLSILVKNWRAMSFLVIIFFFFSYLFIHPLIYVFSSFCQLWHAPTLYLDMSKILSRYCWIPLLHVSCPYVNANSSQVLHRHTCTSF